MLIGSLEGAFGAGQGSLGVGQALFGFGQHRGGLFPRVARDVAAAPRSVALRPCDRHRLLGHHVRPHRRPLPLPRVVRTSLCPHPPRPPDARPVDDDPVDENPVDDDPVDEEPAAEDPVDEASGSGPNPTYDSPRTSRPDNTRRATAASATAAFNVASRSATTPGSSPTTSARGGTDCAANRAATPTNAVTRRRFSADKTRIVAASPRR